MLIDASLAPPLKGERKAEIMELPAKTPGISLPPDPRLRQGCRSNFINKPFID